MPTTAVRKLTPVLIVEAIEPCLPFWLDRLGFQKVAEVPEGDRLGFVILTKDGVEVMYQSRDSVAKDLGDAAGVINGRSTFLFVEVGDLNAVEQALHGVPIALARRRTFYGMDEIGVQEPAGTLVIFAQPAA
jgi:hypothetical protein